MPDPVLVERWPSGGKGRSRSVAYGNLVWTVANAVDASASFRDQAIESLRMLESHLLEAGSARTHLLSVQVMLSDIGHRGAFDRLWQDWIGASPEHWPQRACFQSALAPGLLLELVAVAAPVSAAQVSGASPASGASSLLGTPEGREVMSNAIAVVTTEVLQAFADAWNRHDADALMSFMSDDCVFEAAAGPDICGTRYEGREAVRAAFAEVWATFPDANWGDARHFAHGDKGVSEWTFSGTRADGTRVEVHGCDLLTFRDGKITLKNSYRKNRPPLGGPKG